MFTWDGVTAAVIIIFLLLAIISRITGKGIGEILAELKDFALGEKEDSEEKFVSIYE